jgi:hypothetical protein
MMIEVDYEKTIPYEIVDSCQQYVMADYRIMGINGSHLYLIQDRVSGKYNVYSVECYVTNWNKFEQFLVEKYKSVPIDIAYFLFPHYALCSENYGF